MIDSLVNDPLVIDDLHVSRQDRAVLEGVSLRVDPGSVAVIMGRSGAGKSTILRCIAALEPFDRGTIRLGDVALHSGPVPPQSALRALRSRVGIVFQAHALFEHLSVIENLMLAPVHALGWDRDQAFSVAHRLLAELEIADRADALPRQLSGGEAQRAAIARALVIDPAFLLLDEPTASLDLARRTALASIVRTLATQGRGLLISTHDADFAASLTDRVHMLEKGRLT